MTSTFKYEKIPKRNNLPVRYKSLTYPQWLDKDLPRNYFSALFAGQRNSGKTEACILMLKNMEMSGVKDGEENIVEQRIILFCPTISGNMKFFALKHLDEDDVYTSYSDEKLVEVLQEITLLKQETEEYKLVKKLLKKYARTREDLIPMDDIILLMKYNFELPPPPRYPNGVITHIVLDDLLSSTAFKSTGKSKVTDMVLNGRHLGVNIYILAQNLMALPKSIRINCTVLAFFRFGQRKVQEDIYEECSGIMSFDTFQKLYDEVTKEPYCFLMIDHTQKRENRVKKCYTDIVKY